MARKFDRRTLLLVACGIAVATAAPAPASAGEIGGAVTFENGGVIPAGDLEITLDDPATPGDPGLRGARTRVRSDGKSTRIPFSITADAPTGSPTLRIVARLERADGWLLARGSAPLEPGSPTAVVLNTVMY